jgi:hypothetical protein
MGPPPLTDEADHLVIDAGQKIDAAESAYRKLGFHLTARGRHSIGSVNHLAVFEGPYLELLGFESASTRSDLAGFPMGLNGLVLKPRDPETIYNDLVERGIHALPPADLSRPVQTASDERVASFKVVRLAPDASGFGRLYFCHHLTPELVWEPNRPAHANGATRISKALVIADDTDAAQRGLKEILGEPFAQNAGAIGAVYRIGRFTLEILRSSQSPARLHAILPRPEGRRAYMAVLTLKVADLNRTAALLKANGVEAISRPESVLIAARDAFNVGIEFETGS